MKNKLWLIALLAIIGFSFAACSSGDDGVTTVPVTGITLNQGSITLTVGGTVTLTATVAPDNATNKAVSWKSSDTAKATVSNGVVTAVAEGTAKITVTTADGGKTADCTVIVTDGSGDIGGKTPITVAEITITAPVNGGTPATTVSSTSVRFTAGTVTWSPNDDQFKPNEEYTATVTLTANSDYTFTGLNADNATINNSIASILSNTGETLTLSHKFPKTSTKIVTGIAIKSSPTTMTYSHGDELDLSGMVVTLTYNEGVPEDVAHIEFADYGITPVPYHGTHLVHSIYNNQPIKIEYGNLTPIYTTDKLTVAAIHVDVLTIEPNPIPAETYTGGYIEPAIKVTHRVEGSERILTKDTDYTLSYSNNKEVGTATITITGKKDYTGTRTINFTINPDPNKPDPNLCEHDWSAWEVFTPATVTINDRAYTADGIEKRTCSICEDVETRPIEQYVIEHDGYLDVNLRNLPDNTTTTPYKVRGRTTYTMASTISIIKNRSDRFVILDFSGLTETSISGINGCTNLIGITLPDSVTSIGNSAFSGCTNLTSIIIPNNVNSIGNLAFNSCTSLTSVIIGSGVTSIGSSAFNSCTSLTSITIPNSVNSITGNPVVRCTSLTAINVDSGNSAYSSQDGILYNKDKTNLISYPAGKTGNQFIIPNTVTSIGGGAFNSCINFTSVTIPNNVTSIGASAFYFCTNLTSVTFATGSNIPDANFGDYVSPEGSEGNGGNTLKTAYNAASPKAGTYTRAANGDTWSKQ
jgi:hypothetical protein